MTSAHGRGRVVVAGSLNADLVVTASRLPGPGETVTGSGVSWFPGGKGGNQAVAAVRAGASVTMIGCVGDDDHGTRLGDGLTEAGVDTGRVRTIPGSSGLAVVLVDADGENSIVVVGGANEALAVEDVTALGLDAGDVAVAPLESPPAVIEAFFADTEATTILNPTPVERCTPAMLALADIVVVNEHEADLLGAALDDVAAVIVTLGGAGVDLRDANGTTHIDPVAVDVVDTTGAGDCFVGTLAAMLASGCTVLEAVEHANRAAADSVTRVGAQGRS